MFEQPQTPEQFPIRREEVLLALRKNGKENPVTMELLNKWREQGAREVEKLTEKEQNYRASIEWSIQNAELYIEAGFLEEAWDDLNETGEIARNASENELCDRINKLMDEIEDKLYTGK